MIPGVNAQNDKNLQVRIVAQRFMIEGNTYNVLVYVKDNDTKKGVKANVVIGGVGYGSTQTNNKGFARIKITARQTTFSTNEKIIATVTATGYPFTRVVKDVTLRPRLNMQVDYTRRISLPGLWSEANLRQKLARESGIPDPIGINLRQTIKVRVTDSAGQPVEGARVNVYRPRSDLVSAFYQTTRISDSNGYAVFAYEIPEMENWGWNEFKVVFRATKTGWAPRQKGIPISIYH